MGKFKKTARYFNNYFSEMFLKEFYTKQIILYKRLNFDWLQWKSMAKKM